MSKLGRSFKNSLRRLKSDERGNFVITAAILLPVVAGAVAAAVAYSNASASRTSMQSSLDAAVLAGAIAIGNSQSDPVAIAQNVFQSNVDAHAIKTTNQIAATFSVSGSVVSGQASGAAVNPFGGLIGSATMPLNATSAAIQQTTPVCVLGLNSFASGSFDINGQPQFNASCAVQANSTDKTGMTQEGTAPVIAKKFGVSGGHKTNDYSPAPADGSPAISDPYSSLPFPYYDDCTQGHGNKMVDVKDDTTLMPGTYCGGLHIYATAHVTLEPGIYVMNGGPFWEDGSAVVTGDQVMIGFTGKGATLQLWGNSSLTLTSPTSGSYANMQFMQDNSSRDTHSLWCSIGGSAGNGNNDGTGSPTLTYDGVAYFPTQNFWTFGKAVVNANSPSLVIVADKIWTQGAATVTITNQNPRHLNVAAPPQIAFGARLIN